MIIHDGIENLPRFRQAVITFGSFDGVHFGHREIFSQMKDHATRIGGETVVVTFFPHPRQVIYPHDTSLRLLSAKTEKVHLFEQTGIDHLVICPFTVEFSQLKPDDYIENFVIKHFRPAIIVIGYDHRFGLNRQGNIDFLRSDQWTSYFEVVEIEQQLVDSSKVSSTRIRKHIEDGKIEDANSLLGNPYLLHGKVIKGQQIGSSLGYPTANLEIIEPRKLVPADGIYAVRVHIEGMRHDGMMYIGNRPSIDDHDGKSIEVNLFEFHGDLYGQKLLVEIVGHIREDAHFEDMQALQMRIAQDKIEAQEVLRQLEKSQLSIVILNFNGLKFLKKYLAKVLETITDPSWELVVADNGSTDGSLAWVEKNLPAVRTIKLAQNYGFAEGYNKALELVNSHFALLLNSDVEVTPNWINPLLQAMIKSPELGACQPKIRSEADREKFEYAGAAGGLVDRLGYPFCRGRIMAAVENDVGQYDQISEVFWVTGAAMCIRMDVFKNFGGFDGDYFAHMEEIDLCWRMKRAGYHLKCIPESFVYHVGGGTLSYSSPRKTYLNFRNNFQTLLKNEKTSRLLWLAPFRVLLDWISSIHFLLSTEFGNFSAVWRAHLNIVLNFPKIISKRKTIIGLVEQFRIGDDRTDIGRYSGSIVQEYFLAGKRSISDLKKIESIART